MVLAINENNTWVAHFDWPFDTILYRSYVTAVTSRKLLDNTFNYTYNHLDIHTYQHISIYGIGNY